MRVAALLPALLVLACAGPSPTYTEYLLRPAAAGESGRVDPPVRVGLRRVAVAPYIDQVGIVIETEAGQVQAARYHQWAEPLQSGLRSFLRAEISAALGYEVSAIPSDEVAWDYTVDVHVERLHGTMRGTAVMDAVYLVSVSGEGGIREYRFHGSLPLPREGYPGVVDAEADLARELARSIASALREATGAP